MQAHSRPLRPPARTPAPSAAPASQAAGNPRGGWWAAGGGDSVKHGGDLGPEGTVQLSVPLVAQVRPVP